MRFPLSLAIFTALILCFGCASNVPVPESKVSLLRVKLLKLQLTEPLTDHNVERVKYEDISRSADEIHAYNIAAAANSMLAQYYEGLGARNADEKRSEYLTYALEYYQKALSYDKKEQKLIASIANPFPNADQIAISLNNISFVHEKLGNIDSAISYAERALSINRNLNYLSRVIKDCERLSGLYKKIGNKNTAAKFTEIQKEFEIEFEKQKLMEESAD